jgi:hypothetical protein
MQSDRMQTSWIEMRIIQSEQRRCFFFRYKTKFNWICARTILWAGVVVSLHGHEEPGNIGAVARLTAEVVHCRRRRVDGKSGRAGALRARQSEVRRAGQEVKRVLGIVELFVTGRGDVLSWEYLFILR